MRFAFIAALVAALGTSSIARAQEDAPPAQENVKLGAFDKPFALAGYAVGWAGAYEAAGVGGRARWEMARGSFGVEVLAEHLAVDWQGGFRHDHPIGFNLYVPFALSKNVRIRPLLGACTVFSFVEPAHAGAPRADDILFGVHGGAGIEVAIDDMLSWFLDAQGIVYLAHDRTSAGWTGAVGPDVHSIAVFQPTTGLQLHLGK